MDSKNKVKISGRMSPVFVSQIARSTPVSKTVQQTAEGVKQRLEAKAKAYTKGRGRFRHHYGMKRYRGSFGWGSTFVIWASTPVAKSNVVWFRSAISKAKNTFLKKP